MKKIATLFFLVIITVSGLAAFDGYIDITNATGYTINTIYVSHENLESWGDNMLNGKELLDGDYYRVYLTGHPTAIFDILLEDVDGDSYSFFAVDVEQQDITVTLEDIDGSGGSAGDREITINGPGGDFDGWVEVLNDTGFDIFYMYIKQDSKTWGPDLLGEDILPYGDSFTVNVMNFPHSVFDIRLEDEDEDSYTFRKIDVEVDDVQVTLDNLDE